MSESTSGYLTPDEITKADFDTKRRGFDPEAVKRHLASTAATVHGLLAERNSLAEQLATLEQRLVEAEASPVPQSELDEDALTERLGQDAARVLAEARAAAADRIAEAELQADDIRAAAEELFAQRSAAADEEAQRIRESAEASVQDRKLDAERSAEQIRARAEADAEAARAVVVGERQSADADAARLVREAELTRRQILEDLARRRSAARRQIEQLRAGRERLLASHEMVRRALDDISEELTISMSEARAAAETAGHSVSDTTIEELEAEIETARLTGLLDTGPVPVVTSEPAPFDHETDDPDPEVAGKESRDADAGHEPSAGTPNDEAEPETANESVAPPSVPEVADESSESTDAPESETPAGPTATDQASASGLAEVVQLDRARNDVDTATHPATGRDASSSRSTSRASDTPADGVADEPAGVAPSKAPKLEAVATPPESPETTEGQDDSNTSDPSDADSVDDDSVGDLFASLRSTTPAAGAKKASSPKKATPKKSTPKKASAKKSSAKKAGPKKSGPKKSESKPPAEEQVDSSEMTRRLKRVLADEQSRAMSQLKGTSTMPTLDDLLGDPPAHLATYWAEVTNHIDNVADSDDQLKKPVDELIESIRRRVGDALTDAGDDSEAAVSSLRSVYREVKIQRISICADQVCRMATGRSADRS